ncbi:MAG: SpvB/TcaC N-terminal domain-containing protein [Cyanobium sp. CZS 25K]|nr:SpvB/TcaC N-terminal domain-containing protein [Cyanobium sp. CZS25K]
MQRRDDEEPKLGAAVGAAPRTDSTEPAQADPRSVGSGEGTQQTPAQEQPWVPKVEMPRGGGAIRGIGERFEANAFTGAGAMSIPIATSPCRGAVAPSLGLSYASGSGNGPFGLGWSLAVPAIRRKTEQELPIYRDALESDTFLLAGSEDLVPLRDAAGLRVREERDGFAIYPYRPRVEGGFARIERWVSLTDGTTHWQVRTPDNVVARYGSSPQSRLSDPEDRTRVFEWRLEEARDDRGNIARYTYKAEDDAGPLGDFIAESNRGPVANLHLSRIEYGNGTPELAADFLFEVVFDYGEYGSMDQAGQLFVTPAEQRPWALRPDPFSSFRSGFDLRTRRRCNRVLMFHRISSLSTDPRLVASTDFIYDEDPHLAKLTSVIQRAYSFDSASGGYVPEDLPALRLEYSSVELDPRLVEIDESSLENVGPGIDGVEFRFADLDGEGLPGILSQQGDALYYKRPLGDGRFGSLALVGEQPTTARLGQGAQLADLDGDGRLEFAVRTLGHSGSYARVAGGWEAFEPFETVPNIDWADPDLQQLDLNGDGRADLLIARDDHFIWYPSLGRHGHGPGRMLPKPARELDGPAVLFADGTGTFQLADMSGDGLQDIVRIENGAVHYWPNLGHGRFGRRVTMDGSPFFCARADFQPAHVRLGDLDGSGTTDILYLDNRGARSWLNRSGNAFSGVQHLRPFPGIDAATAVEVRDVFGKGTASLVWSTAAGWAEPHQVMVLDLLPQKPHLLLGSDNGMGLQTRLSYEPSTTQYLRDRAAGRPWLTTLPFPTYVVTRVESYDAIARRRFVQTYAYHHGHYDGIEREFRGFAMVERWDTESYEDFAGDGLFELALFDRVEAQLHQPPVYTKTWFHTGAHPVQARISRQLEEEYWSGDPQGAIWRLPDTVLPDGLSARECLEAARALRGRALRSEVYGLDGSGLDDVPYAVSETNFTLRLEQPAAPEHRFDKPAHAVVFAHAREALSLHYERDADNPRVAHALVLDVDAHGNVTRSAQVGYPARNPEIPEQQQSAVLVSNASFCLIDTPDAYRTGVPFASSSHELHGFPVSADARVDMEALRTVLDAAPQVPYETSPAGPARRLLSRTHALYYADDLAGPLPPGQCGVRALPFASRGAVLSEGQRAAVFGDDVDAALLEGEGGYGQAEGLWWSRSGTQVFDPARFYLPTVGRDPFGNEARVAYDDHHLFVTGITDALGNVARFEHDYRVLAPFRSTDPNGNRTQMGFDTFGRVIAMALMGSEGTDEGDTPEDPTATFSYDVFAWQDRGEPLSAYGRARETHRDPATRWQESWTYFDGSGSTLLAKANAEPGEAPQRDANGALILDGAGRPVLAFTARRYVGSGRTVFDNKGNPVKQYEPYFSSTAGYEDEAELREQGVTPVLHYDPLGRLVWTDFPDGSFARVEFGPWTQVSHDRGDTVLESAWYAERIALEAGDPRRRAATLSARCHGTPTVSRMDALGRAVRVVTENLEGELAEARVVLDIAGNTLQVIDARGNSAQENVVGMAGQVLQETSVDAGWRRAIADVVGNPLRAFNERGFTFRWRYDPGLRPTHQFVEASGEERLTTRTIYGESLDTPEALNLRGQAYRVYDGAGVQTAEAYDFKGALVAAERRLAIDVTQTLDWSALSGLEDVAELEAAASGALDVEVFRTESTFDALGRPVTQTTPDRSVVRLTYNEAALLEGVSANLRGPSNETTFVSNIDYDAKGRRSRISYGNGTETTYTYDPVTQRLTRLLTTGPARRFQDLAYTYDVVGNIVQITDAAQQWIYYNGEVTSGTQRFEYDALYRLIRGEGREHIGQNAAQPSADDPRPVVHPQDGGAMRNYTQQYVYDVVGNILSMQHSATNGDWNRRYRYATDGNRLLANTATGDAPGEFSHGYTYDAHGNMTSMPHLSEVVFDHADQMRSADLGGGGMVYFVYDAAGQRVRKVRINQSGSRTFERIYLGPFELYRERTNGAVRLERETLHIADDAGRMCDLETRTVQDGDLVPSPTTHQRYQYSNHLGSAALELTEAREVISCEEYHPYGTSSYQAVNSSIDVSPQRYRYTGKERDEETGLSYHGARYYACWLGRWTASDPIGLGDGVNRYAYVSGNPLSLRDPGGTAARPPKDVKFDLRDEPNPDVVKGGTNPTHITGVELEGRLLLGDFDADSPYRFEDLTKGELSEAEFRFKQDVYREAVAQSARERTFVWGVADIFLTSVSQRIEVQSEVAAAASDMLAAANRELGTSFTLRDLLSSSYRDADEQFDKWDASFARKLEDFQDDGGKLNAKGAEKLARRIREDYATPGYSKHQRALALDFRKSKFRGSELEEWMNADGGRNARQFGFEVLPGEFWHWNYIASDPLAGESERRKTGPRRVAEPLEREYVGPTAVPGFSPGENRDYIGPSAVTAPEQPYRT